MRYAVWLNGLSLADIDRQIYITDIAYTPQQLRYTTNKLMGRDGQYSGKDSIESNAVTVTFMLRQYDTARRQSVLQDIVKWAVGGGVLTTSDRPGQQLRVKTTRLPGITSVMRWTDTLTLEFTAYDMPYWQDIAPQTAQAEYQQDGQLYCPGVRPAFVEATVTTDAALAEFTLTCGDTHITLEGLTLAQGATVTVSYTADHNLLQITSGGQSLLAYRTEDSDDDLIANPGMNTVSVSASITATFSVKGVWV